MADDDEDVLADVDGDEVAEAVVLGGVEVERGGLLLP
jgi:hypothetical protein